MPTILSGLIVHDELKKSLAAKIKALQEKRGGSPLTLAIIQVGNRADSTAYINGKKKFATEIGVIVKLVNFQENVSQEEIIYEIKKINQDKEITGIIVQLPLPKHFDEQAILDAVDPAKDADAITFTNIKRWTVDGESLQEEPLDNTRVALVKADQYKGSPCTTMYPATARGISELLDFYKISLKGKRVCVIGRSKFVGTPIAALCRAKGALVTICHSKTTDLKKETLASDIIISAVGKAGLITAEHVHEGQVVIDVGISEVVGDMKDKESKEEKKRKLVGDVDFEKVKAVIGEKGAITPVPGGVGPMTVLALFENLVDCAINSQKSKVPSRKSRGNISR
jgi:methylenetetrahydrofolate dehydrogenase (NADP+)/methenyltetrahydrofolate cyclohydrolase